MLRRIFGGLNLNKILNFPSTTVYLTKMMESTANSVTVEETTSKMAEVNVHHEGKKKSKKNNFILKTAKGARDIHPVQRKLRKEVLNQIEDIFERHDAVSIETPVFELKELLTNKYGEDSKLIYDLQDQGGEILALRYDLTVPFARYVAMYGTKKIRRYQIGNVYRRDQPAMNSGRFREFCQCDFDIAEEGDLMLADAECLKIVHNILSDLKVGNFIIKVNHRLLLDGLFASCGVPKDKFTQICSAVDKLDKMAWKDVKHEMVVIKGLDEAVADKIGEYVQLNGGRELVTKLKEDAQLAANKHAVKALDEIDVLLTYCETYDVMTEVKFDLSLARGLDYYTGMIFEAILTDKSSIKVINEGDIAPTDQSKSTTSTEAVSVGSVAAGGRYDNLIGTLSRKGLPCVGLSIGVERLFVVMEQRRNQQEQRVNNTQLALVSAHKNLVHQRIKYAELLRAAGFKVANPIKRNPDFRTQMQFCEDNKIPLAVVIGEGELANNQVKVRNVASRSEELVNIDNLIDHLKQLINS